MDAKPYLEYLDKEMTVMGLLSAFSLAALGLVLDKAKDAPTGTSLRALWADPTSSWALGLVSLFAAALLFYRQRSHLAWLYGQIVLCQVREEPAENLRDWLAYADSWGSWLHYRTAFVALSLGFLELGLALLRAAATFAYVSVAISIAFASLQWHALSTHNNSDHPWEDWWRGLRGTPG